MSSVSEFSGETEPIKYIDIDIDGDGDIDTGIGMYRDLF